MLQIKIDEGTATDITLKDGQLLVSGKPLAADLIRIAPNKFHALVNNRSVSLEVVKVENNGKVMQLMVNGRKHNLEIKDQFDLLLKELNMDKLLVNKSNDIKAPMPGLVLSIRVKEGEAIKKGDPLLVLEAMKMENVIKAHTDGVVRKVMVAEKTAVEKNQVLVTLD